MTEKTTGAMQQVGFPTDPTAPGTGSSAGLVLLYAEQYEQMAAAWPFAQRRVVVGSGENADVHLPVNAVSRVHAEVVWEAGAWILRDLGSRNGTLVHGNPIEEAQLEQWDEVRCGDAVLKFVTSHADEYARYRVDGLVLDPAGRYCRQGTALVGGLQMDRIASDIERIAPTELSVMLLGESGTGKEIVARELHEHSRRPGKFCAVNCAAIPGNLLESELFGYKRGAFTGANRDKPGLIHTADDGTLLLDEIGDMPMEAQAKLLRVLQHKEVFPLGSTAPERVNVRVVCATHRDLWRLQRAGKFREDLFARLNEYQLRLPPLRERKEDVLVLVRAFLARQGRPTLALSFPVVMALLHYDWPYNVRELEACVKRCVALCTGDSVDYNQLPDPIQDAMRDYGRVLAASSNEHEPATVSAATSSAAPTQPRAVPSEQELRSLLSHHRGNVAAVGRELGKARMQIHRWMKRYGIQVDDYR